MQKRVQFWGALRITKNWFLNDFWAQHGSKRIPKWTPKSMKNRSGSNVASRKGSQTLQGPSEDPPGPHFGEILDPKLDRFCIIFLSIFASPSAFKIACSPRRVRLWRPRRVHLSRPIPNRVYSIQHTTQHTAYNRQHPAWSIQRKKTRFQFSHR